MAVIESVHTDAAPAGATIATVERVAGPVRIPTERYTAPAWAELEAARLWPRTWQMACAAQQVAEPGDFFEYEVGRLSVLIVRGDDGVLRAFQNVCLHRGNQLCSGSGTGLEEIRCGYHRWCWTLSGQLREVPSRKGFGALRNADLPLIPVAVDTWAGMVFVNLDTAGESLAEFLEGVPEDIAWIGADDYDCKHIVSVTLACNWKVLIEAFSETYHVQGIHREMLPMTDDVNSPQRLWSRHGRMLQPYGVPSPRLRDRPTDQEIWEAFVAVMGVRADKPTGEAPGPHPPVPEGGTVRDAIEILVRRRADRLGLDFSGFDQSGVLDMVQYNLFPNLTVLFFADMKQVIRARPGSSVDQSVMDVFSFDRRPVGDAPGSKPQQFEISPDQPVLGLVLNQDVRNLQRAQRGLYQPGLTHLSISGEECRIINLHRNLERVLEVEPVVTAQQRGPEPVPRTG